MGVKKELRVIRAEKRAFTVSESGYPDNQWHFVCDTQAFYGHKTVTLRSILQVGHLGLSLPLFPFVRGDVLPATSSPPHLIVFSTLLCLLSSSSSLPPLLPYSHLS